MAEALEAFGAPADLFDRIQSQDEEQDFEIERENWDTLLAFLACSTQWRKEFAGMSGELIYHGLDYPAAAIVVRMMGHRGQDARDIFAGLQTMEVAALPILNKRR